MNKHYAKILGAILVLWIINLQLLPLRASPEMRVLGTANVSLYFINERTINVTINYTSYGVSGAALAAIFDNETWREYFRDRLISYVKENCAKAEEPEGAGAIKFNKEVEPNVYFVKGENWSRISIYFNLTGEGEPVLGRSGEYWVHYEFRGGFLQLIRGGVLQWLTVVRPPLPLVLIDVLELKVTLPPGYSAVEVIPRESSAFIDWKNDRVVLVWLFRDPSIERRDPAVAGIQSLYLDLRGISSDRREILKKLGDIENSLRKNLPYSFDREEILSLLEKVSLARYKERAFQNLKESYLEELISEGEARVRKIFLVKLFTLSLPLVSLLLSVILLYKERSIKHIRKLFGKISRPTKESEKIMNSEFYISA